MFSFTGIGSINALERRRFRELLIGPMAEVLRDVDREKICVEGCRRSPPIPRTLDPIVLAFVSSDVEDGNRLILSENMRLVSSSFKLSKGVALDFK
jgi:hypothetical protein